MNTHKIIKNILILIVLIVLVVVAFFLYLQNNNSKPLTPDLGPSEYSNLWDTQNFRNAENLIVAGELEAALAAYKTMLTSATTTDPIVKGQLEIRIATLYDAKGERNTAVQKLFEIANDTSAYFITRAFAYEFLARMVYMTRDETVYNLIVAEIVKNEPTFSVGLAIDKYASLSGTLLKRSIDIAPLYLALTQSTFIETEYTNKEIVLQNSSSTVALIRKWEPMIRDIEVEENVGYMLPLALLRRAQVIENIYTPGLTRQAPEMYYKLAKTSYDTYPQARSYNYVYYEYARYLANSEGISRKEDIQILLGHYQTNPVEKQNLASYIRNLEKGSKAEKEYQVLKKIVPGFSL
jgi:hypothetical protein